MSWVLVRIVGPRPIQKSGEKMFCWLTVFWLLISLAGSAAVGQSPTGHRAPTDAAARFATYSVHWQRLPLKDAVERLQTVSGANVLVDRRVDPSVRIELEVSDASVDAIVKQLATASSVGYARIGPLFYLGPEHSAERLASLVARRRRDVNSLSPEARTTLLERRRIAWPQLTEPRELVTRLLADHGWQINHGERIPHDLWSAGALPKMALADQLTVLLAEFDLTYHTAPDGRVLEVVPADWKSIAPTTSPSAAPRRMNQEPAVGKQVYTLRVESQPVGKILEQLGRRLGWQISVDDDALRRSSRTLDERVSFSVENADEDTLLKALLTPAGLKANRDGRKVRIQPR